MSAQLHTVYAAKAGKAFILSFITALHIHLNLKMTSKLEEMNYLTTYGCGRDWGSHASLKKRIQKVDNEIRECDRAQ